MDVILKDVTLDGLIYLKSLIVKHQTELILALKSIENESSKQDLLEEIKKLDNLILDLF